jgi:hypothetical protein
MEVTALSTVGCPCLAEPRNPSSSWPGLSRRSTPRRFRDESRQRRGWSQDLQEQSFLTAPRACDRALARKRAGGRDNPRIIVQGHHASARLAPPQNAEFSRVSVIERLGVIPVTLRVAPFDFGPLYTPSPWKGMTRHGSPAFAGAACGGRTMRPSARAMVFTSEES